MKQIKVLLTPSQKKLIDQKFKELRVLKEIEQEILKYQNVRKSKK
jgi:hypothetical protein